MAKSRSKSLQEQSLQMALGAIEIYNKPNFGCRDHAFPILMVNAWESLAKAQILRSHRNQLRSLYVKESGKNRYKRKKNGDYFTIGPIDALRRANVPKIVELNVTHLIDIRDASTHLPQATDGHKQLVFGLGAASLKSYALLLRDWFNVGLSDFDFFILPLGFSYPFATLSSVEVDREPAQISRILKEVSANQEIEAQSDGFHLVCEISVELTSSKRITRPADLTAEIGEDGSASVVTRIVSQIDKYLLTYQEVWDQVKAQLPYIKQSDLNQFIRENNIKDNSLYSAYSYPNHRAKIKGPTKNTASIYSRDLLKYCVSSLQELNDSRSHQTGESN